MYKYIQFDVRAVDNLKLGKFDRDAGNWYSHTYIPGSVIKGAIVWEMVQRKGDIDKKILNGDTIFYNAYPLVDGENTIPMIQGYVGDKQEIRSKKADIRLRHSFNTEKNENTIAFNNYEFAIYEKNSSRLKGYNTKLIEKLHINKKDAKDGNKTLMFRYEAVNKGECFRGYIRVGEELADDIFSILSKNVLYFGGSRGSGYGKCEISNVKYVISADLFDSDTNIDNDLYIYFLSDAILYYNGKADTKIPEAVLEKKLGLKGKCEFVTSFVNLDKAAAYNNMYHTNTVCYTCVTKGSILRYKVNERIDPGKIRELVLNGVGIRKEDGYGQIAILGKIPDNILVSGYAQNADTAENKAAMNPAVILNDEEKKQVCLILKNIFYSRAALSTEKLVIKLLNRKKADESAQAQIGKILNLFQNSLYKSEAQFKQELKDYLGHMSDKRGKIAWHKLSGITFSYNGSRTSDTDGGSPKAGQRDPNVQSLLLDFIDGKSNVIFDELRKISGEGINLGDYRYPGKDDEKDVIYTLQQRFFINLFEQYLRIKG